MRPLGLRSRRFLDAMYPKVKSRLASWQEMFKTRTMAIVSLVWVALGAFDLIKVEFLPDKYQQYTAIRLITYFSWRWWLTVLLVLLLFLLLEGGHAALQKRETTLRDQRLGMESTHAMVLRELNEQLAKAKSDLAEEKLKQKAPRLFLEYSATVAAQYGMAASGLFLKNDGGRAFNVEFEPEVRSGLTLAMDNPAGSVDAENPHPINLHYCYIDKDNRKIPMGGLLSGRITRFFTDLLQEGEKDFVVTIKCQDFEGRDFNFRSILAIDAWSNQITSRLG
jgi:hypothetical protein